MELLRDYGLKNKTGEEFNLFFSIPDNCEYSISEKDGINTVRIQLKKGETAPTNNFIPYDENIYGFKNDLAVEFEQEEVNGWGKKPKMKIESCC